MQDLARFLIGSGRFSGRPAGAALAEIEITDSKGGNRTIALEPSRRYSVGRAQSNDIVVRDLSLSRRHAEIYFSDGRWLISDTGSANGTFVDGRAVKGPVPLVDGSRVALGACMLEIRGTGSPAAGREAVQHSVSISVRPLSMAGTIVLAGDAAAGNAGADVTGQDVAAMTRTVELLQRRLAVVEKANLELLAHEPVGVLQPRILDMVFEAVGPDRAALLRGNAGGELVCEAFRGGRTDGMSISRTIADMVVKQRVSVLTADAFSDARFAEAMSVQYQRIGSAMAAPLWDNEHVIGLIYADTPAAGRVFTEEDLRVLTMLANVAAIRIQNALRFEEQLERRRLVGEAAAAARVQQGLLPRGAPAIEGYGFAGYNIPCHEVGGDYYDCVPLGPGRHGIVIGDVAGKGMGAALLMAVLQAAFHAFTETDPGPARLTEQLNRTVCRSAPTNRFVTLFYMELDTANHRVSCINAGHAPPPLLVRASGEMRELITGGLPLGVLESFESSLLEVELGPRDFIFACSDGVTDALDREGRMFGDDRLRSLLVSLAGAPAGEVRAGLERALAGHSDGTPAADDLTVVILQRQA